MYQQPPAQQQLPQGVAGGVPLQTVVIQQPQQQAGGPQVLSMPPQPQQQQVGASQPQYVQAVNPQGQVVLVQQQAQPQTQPQTLQPLQAAGAGPMLLQPGTQPQQQQTFVQGAAVPNGQPAIMNAPGAAPQFVTATNSSGQTVLVQVAGSPPGSMNSIQNGSASHISINNSQTELQQIQAHQAAFGLMGASASGSNTNQVVQPQQLVAMPPQQVVGATVSPAMPGAPPAAGPALPGMGLVGPPPPGLLGTPLTMPPQQQPQRHGVKIGGPMPVTPAPKAQIMYPDVPVKPDENDKGPKQLIVSNFVQQVTVKELYELFFQFGPLECAKILTDTEGKSRECGFLYFGNSEDAARALKELQGFELYGKAMRMGYAVPQRAPPVKPEWGNKIELPKN